MNGLVVHQESFDRPEYVLHAKVKNNLVLSRILAEAKNVSEFCERHGLNQTAVGDFINLKSAAINAHGEWRQQAQALADALNVLPEEIFTEEQRYTELKTNQAFIEMTRSQMLAVIDERGQRERDEITKKLLENTSLTTKERQLLTLRFYKDMSLEECGDCLSVSRERIRQIEAKALRKLRNKVYRCGKVTDAEIHATEKDAAKKQLIQEKDIADGLIELGVMDRWKDDKSHPEPELLAAAERRYDAEQREQQRERNRLMAKEEAEERAIPKAQSLTPPSDAKVKTVYFRGGPLSETVQQAPRWADFYEATGGRYRPSQKSLGDGIQIWLFVPEAEARL